jgi:hypothetical protein
MQSATRVLLGLAAAVWLLAATPAAAECPEKTRLTDTVYNADGSPAAGRVVIAWPSYTIGDCQVIAGQTSIALVGGVLDVELYPNDAAVPEGTSYRATYYLRSGRITTEYWVVPSSSSPVGLPAIRATSVPVPAVMVGMAQVTGLVPALTAKLELPSPCPAGRFLQATGSANPPGLACVDGTGAPPASSTVSGTVKTETDDADPRVYSQAGVDARLAGKAAVSHAHAVTDVAGLQATLDGKAAAAHTHPKSDITDFAHTHSAADVTSGAFGSERIAAGAIDQPGKLSASLCAEGQVLKKLLGVWACAPDAVGEAGAVSWGEIGGTLANQSDLQSALDGKAAASHTHVIADVTNLQSALDGKQPLDADLVAIANLACDENQIIKRDATFWVCAADAVGEAGAVNWGEIGGTLSDQTDLQSALGGKQGADADLDALAALATTGFVRRTGAATFITAAASGTGSCTNQFVRALNDNAAPTCASVATADIGDANVSYAKIQNVAGFSVFGKATTGAGAGADITAGTDGVLRRSGSGDLAFGTLVTANIGDSQITTAKIADANVTPAKLSNAARDRVITWTLLDPATGDTGKLRARLPAAATIITVACDTDTGTVSINPQKRSRTTPNTAGTNALSASLVCDSNAEETSTINSAAISASELLALVITATASSPTVVNVYVTVRLD